MPLSLRGEDTEQTRETREFARRLARRLGEGVRDEALSGLSEAKREHLMNTLTAIRSNLSDRGTTGPEDAPAVAQARR